MWEDMNTIGLKFLSNEVAKLAKTAIGISKKVVTACLRAQFKLAVFPVYFVYGGLTYVYKKSFASDSDDDPDEQPPSSEVCAASRRITNYTLANMREIKRQGSKTKHASVKDSINKDQQNKCKYATNLALGVSSPVQKLHSPTVAFLGVSDFSGSKLMWDIPIISAKASCFAQCVQEEREDDIPAARKALEEHSVNSSMPNTRQEYYEMIKRAKNEQKYSAESSSVEFTCAEPGDVGKVKDNMLVDTGVLENNCKQVKFRANALNRHSPKYNKNKLSCNSLVPQNTIVYRETAEINKTLKKIQVTCSRLLGGLTNLNEGLAKVISMKEKLTNLEFQVDEGKRLLQEVESERFIMKSKLTALEKLINEEEKFLSGDSYESGFYESECTDNR